MTASEQSPKHSVSVAAAIVDAQERFLVIRRADNGRWEPPGGVLELEESITDGLIREVHEETGVDVRPIALTGVYKNMRRGIVALVFRCKIVAGTPRTSDEAREIAWFSADDLVRPHERRVPGPTPRRTRRSVAVVRAHDGFEILA